MVRGYRGPSGRAMVCGGVSPARWMGWGMTATWACGWEVLHPPPSLAGVHVDRPQLFCSLRHIGWRWNMY